MTREEAIEVLKELMPIPYRGDGKSMTHLSQTSALSMAIRALEQDSKTGYWIYKEKGIIECSNCGIKSIFLQIRGNEEGGVIDQIKNYCPSCGAKMAEN